MGTFQWYSLSFSIQLSSVVRDSMPHTDCDTHLFGMWLPLIHPPTLLYRQTQCFERIFYIPLHARTDALLSASNVLNHFCHQNYIHVYHPTRIPPPQDSRSLISLLEGVCPPLDIQHFTCVNAHLLPCTLLCCCLF